MSKQTAILANHTLNTTNLELLAKDVSERLQVTVKYGYRIEFDYECLKKGVEPNYEYVILGEIKHASAKKTYTLVDNYFQYHQFIQQYGLNELSNPVFEKEDFLKTLIIEAEHKIAYDLEENYDIRVEFYRDTMDLWLVDDIDWSSFQYFFVYQSGEDFVDYLNQWRIENRNWIYKLGGDFMMVGCQEDDSYLIFEEAEYKNEVALLNLIQSTFKIDVVNIPNYIESKAYLNKPIEDLYITPKMFEAFKKGIPISIVKKDYPVLFYDDFNGLDESKIKYPRLFNTQYDDSKLREQLLQNKNYFDNLKL